MVVVIKLENKLVSCLTEKTHTNQGASDLNKLQEVRALTWSCPSWAWSGVTELNSIASPTEGPEHLDLQNYIRLRHYCNENNLVLILTLPPA